MASLARHYGSNLRAFLARRYRYLELIEDVARDTLAAVFDELNRGNILDRESLEDDLDWTAERLANVWLVRRIGQGDEKARAELLRIYRPEMHRYLVVRYTRLHLPQSEHDPNLSETVERALAAVVEDLSRQRLKDVESLRTFVYQTVDRVEIEQLVQRIAHADQAAENKLAAACRPGLHTILTKRFSDRPEIVEDVIQDTQMAVIQNLRDGRLREPGAISSYILKIARNKANEHLRSNYRNGAPADPREFERLDCGLDALARLANDDLIELVKQTIEDLPCERDRKLILRYHFYDIDKAVLCRQFGISPAHFDRINYRARKRLKELIEKRTGVPLNELFFGVFLVAVLGRGFSYG